MRVVLVAGLGLVATDIRKFGLTMLMSSDCCRQRMQLIGVPN